MTDTKQTEQDVVEEARELLANAAHGPLTLIRYEHGGGRLYREEPRDLIADFYDAANRELHYRAPELIKSLCDEVERLRSAILTTLNENGYLADGDTCTLIHLKRAIGEDHHA